MAKNEKIRQLPLRILWYLKDTLRHEKFTQIGDKIVIHSFFPPFPSKAFDRVIPNLISGLKGKVVPLSTYIAITDRCNYHCWHCSSAYRRGKEMPLEVIKGAIRKLQEIGVCIIGFTGGEPLLREDLGEMISIIDSRSTSFLFTTGDGLTKKRAEELKEAGLFGVAISLGHYREEIHDRLSGHKGAFQTALNAIKNSKEAGFYTILQIVATKNLLNSGKIWNFIELAKELGVHEIRLLEPMPTGRLLNKGKNIFLTEEEREKLRGIHIKVNRDRRYPAIVAFAYVEGEKLYGCGASYQHMYIDAQGNVCPCDFTPLSFGNIQKEELEIIWKRLNSSFQRSRRQCFLRENIDKIKKEFAGELPLSYEKSLAICKKCPSPELPDFYKNLTKIDF